MYTTIEVLGPSDETEPTPCLTGAVHVLTSSSAVLFTIRDLIFNKKRLVTIAHTSNNYDGRVIMSVGVNSSHWYFLR